MDSLAAQNENAAHPNDIFFLWKCRESNPSPNPSMRESLRRVVSVCFKAGCEERRRNHSYPIPYLDALTGNPGIDPADNSAHTPDCGNSKGMNVALGERVGALAASRRVGERDIADLTEVRRLLRACKSVLGKFGFPHF